MAKMFVFYKGTIDQFKLVASNYNDKIVFIKGGENGEGAAVYTHGQYFGNVKDALAALQAKVNGMKYFSKISDGTNTATVGSADGTITFSASNPQLVSVDVDTNGVSFGLAKAFTDEVAAATTNIAGEISRATEAESKIRTDLGQKSDSADANGSAFARIAKVVEDINAMTGGNGSIADQINAAISLLDVDVVGGGEGEYIASVKQEDGKIVATKGTFNFDIAGAAAQAKSEVIGTSADASTASTVYGAKKYAEEKAAAAQSAAEGHADSLNTAMDTRVKAVEGKAHEHANKALLDTYTQTEANLADAVAKKHEHSNKEVLDGITATKVSNWDAAEQNAKNYVDGKVQEINGAASTLAGRVSANEGAIATLNGEGEGSVKKHVADEIAKIVNENANGSIDTLNEIASWIVNDTTGAASMANNIARLDGADTVEGSVKKQIKDAVAAEAEIARAAEKKNADDIDAAELRIKAIEDDYLVADDKTELTNAINGKVAQSEYDAKMTELGNADTGLSNRIQALESAVGSNAEGDSLAARMTEAEGDIDDLEALMSGSAEGSVNKRISDAVAGLKGDAADDYNTLGKLEDKIIAEAGRADLEEKAIRKDFADADATTLGSAKTYTNEELAKLALTDSAVDGQFVTAVSQANGKISVSRANVSASQIGIVNTENDHFAASTQNVQAALNELASFWEWEVVE